MGQAKRRREAASDQLRRVLQLAAGNAERTRHFLTVHTDVPDDLRAEIDARSAYYDRVLEYGRGAKAPREATNAASALLNILQLEQPATPLLDVLEALGSEV